MLNIIVVVCQQLYCTVDLLRYATAVSCQLCQFLDIRCFHITLTMYDTAGLSKSAFVKRRLPSTHVASSSFGAMPSATVKSHAALRPSRAFQT